MPVHRNTAVLGLFVLVFVATTSTTNAECVFNVTNSETEKTQPVPLYNISSDYELAVPHHGLIHLKSGHNITLLCSGNRNYVRQTNSNVTTVRCIEDDDVELYKHVYNFEDIKCKNSVKGDIHTTDEKCGNRHGRIYEIGYPVTRRDWITLITVCYEPIIGNTLYTRHVIHGKEIKYASKTNSRPGFSTAGQYDNITASLVYKQTFQKATFSSILGSSVLANRYINDNSYLSRGHLSPDRDFLLASSQFSTYYYINAAPQWQSINTASWKSIEFTVREMAEYYGNLDIYTGTHAILSYDDIYDIPQQIFLGQDGTIPVPKYFWKTAYDPQTEKAIVFVTVNDPYVRSAKKEVFCHNICEESGFNKRSWKEPSTGYVFCCSLHDFRKTVKTMPKLEVSGVLTYPGIEFVSELRRLKFDGNFE